MFNFILDNGLSKRIISKVVAKWINDKLDTDANVKFNEITVASTKGNDTVRVHLDLDLTMSKEKLLQVLNDKL